MAIADILLCIDPTTVAEGRLKLAVNREWAVFSPGFSDSINASQTPPALAPGGP